MALEQISDWLLAPYQHDNCRDKPQIHRRILVISGNAMFCEHTLMTLSKNAPAQVAISHYDCGKITGKQRKHLLGSECDIAFVNCQQGCKPGDIMAVAGTVKQAGCLVLICPDLKQWPNYARNTYTSYGYTAQSSRYLKRFIAKLTANQCTAIFTATSVNIPPLTALRANSHLVSHFSHTRFASAEQENGYDTLCRGAASGSLKAVITAPRGRGKSSLLGIFINELIQQGKRVLLTSSLQENIIQVMAFIKSRPYNQIDNGFITTKKKGELRWVAPDSERLKASHAGEYDFVIIDEAASFPLPVLNKILTVFSNWILSTTLQGYEGSGSGFLHKVIPRLSTIKIDGNTRQLDNAFGKPNLIQISLTTPLRWLPEDPIERLLNDICLFESNQNAQNEGKTPDSVEPRTLLCEWTSFDRLDEGALQQVMRLLTLAHYQTTPDDLMRLMDSPDLHLFTMSNNGTIVGASVINSEGGALLSPLADKIASGERRPKGHLGAQRLSLAMADPIAATLNYWRINRIAVLPSLQGQGLGTKLLAYITNIANTHAIDALVTSYGTTEDLNRFWTTNGFTFVERGQKPNKASGETSALALRSFSDLAIHVQQTVLQLKQYNAKSMTQAELPKHIQHILRNKLECFTKGYRTLDDVWAIINGLAIAILNKQHTFVGFTLPEKDIITENPEQCIFRQDVLESLSKSNIDVTALKQRLNANGIKALTRIIRQGVATLLK